MIDTTRTTNRRRRTAAAVHFIWAWAVIWLAAFGAYTICRGLFS